MEHTAGNTHITNSVALLAPLEREHREFDVFVSVRGEKAVIDRDILEKKTKYVLNSFKRSKREDSYTKQFRAIVSVWEVKQKVARKDKKCIK